MKTVKLNNYKPIYDGERFLHYKNNNGELMSFWLEEDVEEPNESRLYRIRRNKDSHTVYEELVNGKWLSVSHLYSLQFDGLVEEISVEKAQEIAEQIGETLVD